MSIFDTLAENRYQQWLEDSASPDYQPPEPVSRTASRTSFEGQLFQQVLALLDKATAVPEHGTEPSRPDLLAQADALAFQLQISLEKKNLPLVAATLAASIRQKRSEITWHGRHMKTRDRPSGRAVQPSPSPELAVPVIS